MFCQALSAALQKHQRVKGQLASGCLGRQKKQLVQTLAGHGLEQRKHRANGLANACGGLRHQALASSCSFVNGLGQFTLAGPEAGMRKSQRGQRGITRQAVRQLLVGPDQKAFALRLKIVFQHHCREVLAQGCFLQAGNVKVNNGQVDLA